MEALPSELPTPAIPSGVAPGWFDLLTEMHQRIVAVAPDYQLSQVKEKFGGLRVYLDHSSLQGCSEADLELVNHYVAQAEEEAAHTCEECGVPAATGPTSTGWHKTLCEKHQR